MTTLSSSSLTLPQHGLKSINMDMPSLQRLAPPAVTTLVCFLAYSSQWLFYGVEPGPLRKGDAYLFNGLVVSLLICYWRSCTTDPGRISKDWHERNITADGNNDIAAQRQRWCRKCEAFKPPRAHHCKTCKRYVFSSGYELPTEMFQLHRQNGPSLRLDR